VRTRALVLAILLAVGSLAGCGGDEATPDGVTPLIINVVATAPAGTFDATEAATVVRTFRLTEGPLSRGGGVP